MKSDYTVLTHGPKQIISPFRFTKTKAVQLCKRMNHLTDSKVHVPIQLTPHQTKSKIKFNPSWTLQDVLTITRGGKIATN